MATVEFTNILILIIEIEMRLSLKLASSRAIELHQIKTQD
jgi:hypothetical protein